MTCFSSPLRGEDDEVIEEILGLSLFSKLVVLMGRGKGGTERAAFLGSLIWTRWEDNEVDNINQRNQPAWRPFSTDSKKKGGLSERLLGSFDLDKTRRESQ